MRWKSRSSCFSIIEMQTTGVQGRQRRSLQMRADERTGLIEYKQTLCTLLTIVSFSLFRPWLEYESQAREGRSSLIQAQAATQPGNMTLAVRMAGLFGCYHRSCRAV